MNTLRFLLDKAKMERVPFVRVAHAVTTRCMSYVDCYPQGELKPTAFYQAEVWMDNGLHFRVSAQKFEMQGWIRMETTHRRLSCSFTVDGIRLVDEVSIGGIPHKVKERFYTADAIGLEALRKRLSKRGDALTELLYLQMRLYAGIYLGICISKAIPNEKGLPLVGLTFDTRTLQKVLHLYLPTYAGGRWNEYWKVEATEPLLLRWHMGEGYEVLPRRQQGGGN